ncbi:MAG TPA: hypothetical protein VJ739_02445, partial [Gemmataceae bacterium]|nr:hypothetical protein [Gemmataceae bacterium]
RCIERDLANNPRQCKASEYARQLRHLAPGGRNLVLGGVAHEITPELYASGFKGEHPKYLEALRRTWIEGIINFYKASYPRPPYHEQSYPPVKCPVLMIHG